MIWVNEVIELKGRIGKLVDEIWEDTTCLTAEDLPHHDKEHYKAQIIEAFKQAGGVLLSDNQELPKNPYKVISGYRFDIACDDWDISTVIEGSNYRGYDIAQQDMKDFKRVIELP